MKFVGLINNTPESLKHNTKKKKKRKIQCPPFLNEVHSLSLMIQAMVNPLEEANALTFPRHRESFFNLVKDVSQLGSMVPSYPLIVKASKFAKITCGRFCSSTMWWFVRVIFRSTFHFTSLHILDSNKIILLGHYYFHLVFNIPLSYPFFFWEIHT